MAVLHELFLLVPGQDVVHLDVSGQDRVVATSLAAGVGILDDECDLGPESGLAVQDGCLEEEGVPGRRVNGWRVQGSPTTGRRLVVTEGLEREIRCLFLDFYF